MAESSNANRSRNGVQQTDHSQIAISGSANIHQGDVYNVQVMQEHVMGQMLQALRSLTDSHNSGVEMMRDVVRTRDASLVNFNERIQEFEERARRQSLELNHVTEDGAWKLKAAEEQIRQLEEIKEASVAMARSHAESLVHLRQRVADAERRGQEMIEELQVKSAELVSLRNAMSKAQSERDTGGEHFRPNAQRLIVGDDEQQSSSTDQTMSFNSTLGIPRVQHMYSLPRYSDLTINEPPAQVPAGTQPVNPDPGPNLDAVSMDQENATTAVQSQALPVGSLTDATNNVEHSSRLNENEQRPQETSDPPREREDTSSTDQIRRVRNMFYERHALDLYLWNRRAIAPANQRKLLDKCEQSDHLLREIRSVVDSWTEDLFEEHEWEVAQEIKSRLLTTQPPSWVSVPPWKRFADANA